MNLNKVYKFLIAGLCLIGLVQTFTFSTEVVNKTIEAQEFYAAKHHSIGEYDFCGEDVPTNSNDLRERLEKELLKNSFWHSEMLIYQNRINKYFPIIEPILKKNNIPNDFKYLAVIESGLTNAVSPAGARGFWQIMPKTGKEYGLQINSEVDERYHLEKATEAACIYLKTAYKKFGSWTLVAASYNMGMSGLAKRLRQQKVNSYYDLLLNSETSRYVFRIIAVKDILSNPRKYGFNIKKENAYPVDEFEVIKYDSTISSLTDFAIENNITYKILKLSNPWLRRKKLTNSKRKVYEFKIPTNGYHVYSTYECYSKSDSSNLADSLKHILCADSTYLKTTEDSIKNSIILDSASKNIDIEKPIK